jgi:acetyl esterase
MNRHEANLYDRLLSFGARRVLSRLPGWTQVLISRSRRRSAEGRKLDPCVHAILNFRRRRIPYGLVEPDPVTARERFRSEIFIFEGAKTEVGGVRDLEVGGAAGLLCARLYTPPTPTPAGGRRLLVFFHGGGFVLGDVESYDEPCRLLCKHADTLVLSVEYRVAPEHPYPAPLEDALAAFDDARRRAAEFGADPARVSVGGDSAGGNLAAVVAQVRASEGRAPSAQLLIYPATDGSERSESLESRRLYGDGLFLTMADYEAFGLHYTGAAGVARDDPRVSPLCAQDFRGLPPALVVVAGFDLLRDEGEEYFEKMKTAAAGNNGGAGGAEFELLRYDTLAHGFINLTGVCPSAREATTGLAENWRRLLDRTGR